MRMVLVVEGDIFSQAGVAVNGPFGGGQWGQTANSDICTLPWPLTMK